jgi:hypothetical protein
MPIAPHFNDSDYWHQRAEEARVLAQQMSNETAKETMLMVAADCDRFAARAAELYFDKLFVSRVINEMKRS